MLTLFIISTSLLCIALLLGLTSFRIPRKPLEGQIRVGCVGDSITYGCAIPGSIWRNYPEHLQKMLGGGYCVRNFGMNDRCAQLSANKPYRLEKLFDESVEFQPNIVVIMLGTNDSKQMNWHDSERFKGYYKGLVSEYISLKSKPQVFLCTPPRVFSRRSENPHIYDISRTTLIEIEKCVREIAAEMDLPLIDMCRATDNRREWFGLDGVHPNAKGASAFAERVYCGIQAARQKRESD